MGFIKIGLIIVTPISLMTYLSFSLGKQLPKASRIFGNYIGLSYIYFKSILNVVKPSDKMAYQAISLVRRASQQSQALRRQIRNTAVKIKDDIKDKNLQSFNSLTKDIQDKVNDNLQKRQQISNSKQQQNILWVIQKIREKSFMEKKQKQNNNRFYKQL